MDGSEPPSEAKVAGREECRNKSCGAEQRKRAKVQEHEKNRCHNRPKGSRQSGLVASWRIGHESSQKHRATRQCGHGKGGRIIGHQAIRIRDPRSDGFCRSQEPYFPHHKTRENAEPKQNLHRRQPYEDRNSTGKPVNGYGSQQPE